MAWKLPQKPLKVTLYDGSHSYGPFTTDAHGTVKFSYMPQLFRVEWQLTIEGPQGKTTFQQKVKPEGYQILLRPQKHHLKPGEALKVRVDSLQRKGVLHFDLVQKGRRIWSHKVPFDGGSCRAMLPFPKKIRGLVSLQTYTEFYYPGEVYDARLLYIGATSPKKLLAQLEMQLSQRGDGMRILALDSFKLKLPLAGQLEAWSKPLLAFAKARFVSPPLLFDSKRSRHLRLRRFQTRFRNRILFGLGVLGGFVLLGIFGWLTWGYRRDHIAMRELKDQAELDDEEIEEIGTRGLPWLIGFFITLLLIFSCIIYLFWAMKWTYDNL